MPLIQRIEVSNLMNSKREEPWRPDWPHQVFELNGENTAMNIPNGKGKSTLVMSILAMLRGHKSLNDIRMRHYAPRRTGRYTHIRIQVLVSLPGEDSNDLIAQAGGSLAGSPMVFGLYGNSGENERVNFYAYRGTFDDCKIATVHQLRHDLVSDKDFLDQLRARPGVFRDSTIKEWVAYLDDFFDMSNLQQQLVYQLARGAEGDSNYFEVKRLPGRNDAASIFYERLAPELLSEVMGQLGEEGENGIEDTIHEKVSRLIVAKRNTAKKAEILRRTSNTVKELEDALKKGAAFLEAKDSYDAHRAEFETEVAAIRSVLVDNPIPGVPLAPPEHLSVLARSMVMQGGAWYMPDSVMGEFTGEEPKRVNERARDRNGIDLTPASRLQVIDFNCDLKVSKRTRGHANQLYTRDNAIALLNVTTTFTKNWTRDKAIEAVTEAFDWVDAHADTNPARVLFKQRAAELGQKKEAREAFSMKVTDYYAERDKLREEQQTIGESQAAYREMSNSSLFTLEELANPNVTGERVVQEASGASAALNAHKDATRELKDVYALWQQFEQEYGQAEPPSQVAARLVADEKSEKDGLSHIKGKILELRGQRQGLKSSLDKAIAAQKIADGQLDKLKHLQPGLLTYKTIFGEENPVGLEAKVTREHREAVDRKHGIGIERSKMSSALSALAEFRLSYDDADPSVWIAGRLAAWEAKGIEITGLKLQRADAEQRRKDLDKAAVAPGRIAREAAAVAGGNAMPLHEAIGSINLSSDRKEKALTLFSSLLHAPVYQTLDEAAQAARNLADNDLESPVFILGELDEFCNSDNILLDANVAHTWLVGVRTRPVDCLLDISLVEREKAIEEARITALGLKIKSLEDERNRLSADHVDAKHAPGAATAVVNGFEKLDTQFVAELNDIEARLPRLAERASDNARAAIKSRIELDALLSGNVTEQSLIDASAEAGKVTGAAKDAYDANEQRISDMEMDQSKAEDTWSAAFKLAQNAPVLLKIQAFVDHPSMNPRFMATAGEVEAALDEAAQKAEKRTRFRFALAHNFIHGEHSRPQEIEERIKFIGDEIKEIQDKLIPALDADIERLQQESIDIQTQAGEIDDLVRTLIRKYREFMADQDAQDAPSPDKLLSHPVVSLAELVRQETDLTERVALLLDLASDLDVVDSSVISKKMRESKQAYSEAKSVLASHIDLTLIKPDLDLSEHVRIELVRGKEDVSVLAHIYKVTKENYDKNSAANATAQTFLDKEWGDVSDWLHKFTLRLPDNLRIMKSIFSPQRDGATGTVIRAGFDISAKLADLQDIKATLDEIVLMVENYEKNSDVINQFDQGVRDKTIADLRREIRNNFYQKVILDPSIHVCMPSISQKPLLLEKNMVSTGQGIAMTLLWIVKMANYVSERELNRKTTNQAHLKRIKANKTQFAIIDGAFSSLSKKELIDDALNSVAQTRGNFQLIITGHDENYQNNFQYFPSLVVAREIGGKFMYADSTTKRMVDPSSVGSHYGAMGLMSLHRTPKVKPDEATT
ncbi:hypothetical protein ACKF11_12920 [Methylobacillus sp. Pita2]|uniref:hypothetical protein n=1 Tax=Methylobacillus sp. Pita2 TaxID=3383245 RepID=UPI0038B45BCA